MSNDSDDMGIYVEKTSPQEHRRKPPAGIAGWGADLDPAARPAYPKERTPPRFISPHWQDLEHQRTTVRVFHSTERPGLTPVFGTAQPPSGLSGTLRGAAFRYSENDMRHWLMLLFADRVNVVEGLLDDLAHGHLPNIFAEMGGVAEWRYNRTGFLRKALVAAAVVGTLVYLRRHRRD